MDTQQSVVSDRPSVVPRSSIPISDLPEDGQIEVRPFGAHGVLGSVIPDSEVALAWTRAGHKQEVLPRSHPTPGLLIILQGQADLVGANQRTVQPGDVVAIPPNQEYGFTAIGVDGLHALHVAFAAGGEAPHTDGGHTLARLLQRNEARVKALIETPFFQLLRSPIVNDQKRAMMRECIRVFSDAYQTFLLTRQATCRDDAYGKMFDEHFREELDHNRLLKVRGDRRAFADPILKATSAWFCHQMIVLDNAGKTVINLLLETGGYYFHTLAKPVFAGDDAAEYFDIHAEADERHKELGVDVLAELHPTTYRRLCRVLDEGYDMLETMTRRMATLVESHAQS